MKILFVHNHLATFTRIDLDILRSQHDVRELYVRHDNPVALARSTYQAIKGALWCDLVFAWFGAFHALLPFLIGKLFGKPCVVVASGYDVANEPEIDYGNMRPGLRRWVGRRVFALADSILAVSNFAADQAMKNAGAQKCRIRVILHGIPELTDCVGHLEADKQDMVLTVGGVNESNLMRKGLLQFAELSAFFPTASFVIIGPVEANGLRRLQHNASGSLHIVGAKYGHELWDYMRRAKVYVQLSAYESFGMAVAEAMLFECIPVVSDRGALSEVVGDVGFTVPIHDNDAALAAIQAALVAGSEMRLRCRNRVLSAFSLAERQKRLLDEIDIIYASPRINSGRQVI